MQANPEKIENRIVLLAILALTSLQISAVSAQVSSTGFTISPGQANGFKAFKEQICREKRSQAIALNRAGIAGTEAQLDSIHREMNLLSCDKEEAPSRITPAQAYAFKQYICGQLTSQLVATDRAGLAGTEAAEDALAKQLAALSCENPEASAFEKLSQVFGTASMNPLAFTNNGAKVSDNGGKNHDPYAVVRKYESQGCHWQVKTDYFNCDDGRVVSPAEAQKVQSDYDSSAGSTQ